jgi:hypothetical protein
MFETIIKSTNGGANWQVIRDWAFGTGNSYFCCSFINQKTGWISGGGEKKILKTYDGGNNFDSIVTNTSGFINKIYFCDSLKGLYFDDNGHVRKTTNGGYNWFSINIPTGTYSYDFQNISFINELTGWVITYSGKVFKTTDFGYNWDSISVIQNSGYPLYSIFFTSNNTGYAGGAGYYLYRSTNGGYNWIQQYYFYPLNGASSIYFVNDTVGWKVTNGGRICYTTNGGELMIISNNISGTIDNFELNQNYPNPFNEQTAFKFAIRKSGIYKFEIFDMLGKKIDESFNKIFSTGEYEIIYKAEHLSSGIYYYKLSSENNFRIKKFLLIK